MSALGAIGGRLLLGVAVLDRWAERCQASAVAHYRDASYLRDGKLEGLEGEFAKSDFQYFFKSPLEFILLAQRRMMEGMRI